LQITTRTSVPARKTLRLADSRHEPAWPLGGAPLLLRRRQLGVA
jgi:hypothetical protein